jgi:hypothetical protein
MSDNELELPGDGPSGESSRWESKSLKKEDGQPLDLGEEIMSGKYEVPGGDANPELSGDITPQINAGMEV